MKKIQDVLNLRDRRILVRVDWNVPLGADGRVDESEADRIEKSLPTLRHLSAAGGKVVVISHIGREKTDTLKPVAEYVAARMNLAFIPTWEPEMLAGALSNMQSGDVILLENLRQNSGEEANDPDFAAMLSSFGDMYVNEAFSVCHRAHASIVGVPVNLPSYAGLWLQQEIENLSKVAKNPARPLLFILGGAKFETKVPLLKKFEHAADEILIGGAIANNFFKEIGFPVGKSLVDKDASVREFFHKEEIKIPFDVVVKGGGAKTLSEIGANDVIADIGPETLAEWKKSVASAKTILWNGPLGIYEQGYDGGSKELLTAISTSGAFSVIGGGDTAELVKAMRLDQKLSFVSTGGGAMLDYLSSGTLPGIVALEANIL